MSSVELGGPFAPLAARAVIGCRRAAPTWQIVRDVLLGERQGFLKRSAKVLLHCFLPDVPAQEVPPKKLSEWNGFLGKSSGSPQLSGK